MNIRLATKDDVNIILDIFNEARSFMRTTGNMLQWANGYPNENVILEDIKKGNSYVVEKEGEVVASFAFIKGEDPTYGYIEGKWLSLLPYGTVHRIASRTNVHGVAPYVYKWCLDTSDDINSLRVDTHEDNKVMQHVLTKFGFSYCGTIYLEDGDPRRAYEIKR